MGVFHVVQTVANYAKHHYLSRFCVEDKWLEEGMEYALLQVLISTPGRVETRFSDSPR